MNLFARLVERDDIAMADPHDRPRLAKPSPASILRVDSDARPDDLDGHPAAQLRLPCLIVDAHSTSAQLWRSITKPGIVGKVLRLSQSCWSASLRAERFSVQPFRDRLNDPDPLGKLIGVLVLSRYRRRASRMTPIITRDELYLMLLDSRQSQRRFRSVGLVVPASRRIIGVSPGLGGD